MVDFDSLINSAVNAVFGETMTYQPETGDAYPVQGVFAEPYRRQEFDADGASSWITTAPSVGLRLADLKAPVAKNDRITRQKTGITYRLGEPHPDGIGWINFILKVSA